jgi:hypothetical protein
MPGWRRSLVLLASLAALVLSLNVPAASAKPLDRCPGIHAMGQLYGLGGKNVKCGFARRWARHYLKRGRVPPGWSCVGRFSEVGNCHKPGNKALFQFYAQD